MKTLIILALAISLTGCATNTETNQLIAQVNADRQRAYGDAMVACGSNAACQVGVSMMFASGAGMQQFIREDSPLDYFRAAGPLLAFGVDVARLFVSPGSDTNGFIVSGDNNQISGFGNRLTADNESSISTSFDSTVSVSRTQSWENMYNPWTDNSRDQVVK